MGIEGSFNFRRVSNTITTSGIVAADDLAVLGENGYAAVINLLPDSSEHAVMGEETIVRGQGLTYVHIPVDFAAPCSEDFDQFAAVMDAHADRTVHVHCAANYRVSVFYALYAERTRSWTVEQADEHIRSVWTPDPVWDAFITSERQRRAR